MRHLCTPVDLSPLQLQNTLVTELDHEMVWKQHPHLPRSSMWTDHAEYVRRRREYLYYCDLYAYHQEKHAPPPRVEYSPPFHCRFFRCMCFQPFKY